MKFQKLVKDILNSSEKFNKIMEGSMQMYSNINVDNFELNDILKSVNNGKLKMFDQVEVSGFLSKYACLEEPITFFPEAITMKKTEKLDEHEMTVKPHPLPIMSIGDSLNDKNMLFIYEDSNPFHFDSTVDDIYVTNKNKYIPVIIDDYNYYRFAEEKVSMICKILPIEKEVISKYFNYSNKKYKETSSFFLNTDYEKYPWIYLHCMTIKPLEKNKCENDIDINFGIEYQFTYNSNDEYFSRKLANALIEAFGEFPNNKLRVLSFNNGSLDCYLLDDKIKVYRTDNCIGFYMETILNNAECYQRDINDLKTKCNVFKNKLKGIETLEISFISDYRKIIDF